MTSAPLIEQCTIEGWGQTASQTVRRFGEQAQVGEFVWTRDTAGRYLLAKITGEYRYDISEAAKKIDVHQVRDVEWAPRPLNDLEVPGGTIRCFVGQGQSFLGSMTAPPDCLRPTYGRSCEVIHCQRST